MSALEPLADGAYAYVQPDGSWFINNAGVIWSGDDVVCIDACATEARTRQLLAAIEQLTGGGPSVLVNTHHHADHTNGNGLLGAPAIISQTRCRAELAVAAAIPPPGLFDPVDWGEIDPRLPNVCFDDRLDLHPGEQLVQLRHLGTPAHTTNDIIAWMPEQRALFAGDLAFNGGTPFALFGSVAGWLETIPELEALEPEIVVPGHGPVGGPEVLRATADYLAFVAAAAVSARDRGLSAIDAARELDLGPFAALTDTERIVGNLVRAIAELDGVERGAPVDLLEAFGGMIAYNGGGPLRCVA